MILKFLEPWYAVAAHEQAQLEAELAKELPLGHVLAGLPVKCLARRQGRDDVLFELSDGSARLACVHLTWQRESQPNSPRTVIHETTELWLAVMEADHAEFDA